MYSLLCLIFQRVFFEFTCSYLQLAHVQIRVANQSCKSENHWQVGSGQSQVAFLSWFFFQILLYCIKICIKPGSFLYFMLFSGSTAFHLFGLATTSLSSWLPPNQEVIVDRNLEFVFRIRYRPFELELLLRVNKEAFNYYYLQVGGKILNLTKY